MHKCGVNRLEDEKGICASTSELSIYSYSPHTGEEPPLSGCRGSGTVFFGHCNLKCVYCQNYKFSQESHFANDTRYKNTVQNLTKKLLELKRMGCHNVNFVSPTHYVYWIVKSLEDAISKSFDLPVVFNTGGYDSLESIKLLDGVVDIYLPDMRYSDDTMAVKFSSAPNYAENNRRIVKEMFRQTGPIRLDKEGIAEKGLIVRLLIIPGNASSVIDALRFLKADVSTDVFLSVMSQYYPQYRASAYPEINRPITREEYNKVIDAVGDFGFTNGWIQGFNTDTERFLGKKIKPS